MAGKWFRSIVPRQDAPAAIDTGLAHPARIYNYWLGGKDNFAADREAGDRAVEANPDILRGVRANRRFLGRAVLYLAGEARVRQFLDIGTGLPAMDNTHEVAQAVAPDARVAYVDNDPIVLAHARALLTSTPEGHMAYIDGDARDTAAVLEAASRHLDFSQPVAIMALMVLQHIPDSDDPQRIVAGRQTRRTRAQIQQYFTGLEMVPPGLVTLNRWRPEPDDPDPGEDIAAYCGIGRKP